MGMAKMAEKSPVSARVARRYKLYQARFLPRARHFKPFIELGGVFMKYPG